MTQTIFVRTAETDLPNQCPGVGMIPHLGSDNMWHCPECHGVFKAYPVKLKNELLAGYEREERAIESHPIDINDPSLLRNNPWIANNFTKCPGSGQPLTAQVLVVANKRECPICHEQVPYQRSGPEDFIFSDHTYTPVLADSEWISNE